MMPSPTPEFLYTVENDPELAELVRGGKEHRARRRSEPDADAVQQVESIGISHDDLALMFSVRHGLHVRYVAVWDRWLIWDGARFARDERRRVFDMVRNVCRNVLAEHLADAGLTEHQRKALRNRLGSAETVWAVARLAGSDPRHAVSPDQLDANPWALNTPEEIIDLRSGCRRPHDPAELHTKITAAALAGECPLFLATLERAQPDPEVRAYLQRLAGYALSGSAREHVLGFWWGNGRNLKGTLIHAIRRAMGDYAVEIAAETLMESHNDRHPTELAVMHGARLVVGSEVDTSRRWNESRLKRLTGGDPVSARYIGKDLFEFEPSHTLVIVGNSKPGLRQVDEAIRARLHLVEFGVTIPEADRDVEMPEKLHAEFGGILNWALVGCVDWLEGGLRPPEAVRSATAAYLAGEDMLQAWLDERTLPGGQVTLAAAHRSYRDWCDHNGAIALGRNTFGDQ
jgi:putative DNA primase/helicase